MPKAKGVKRYTHKSQPYSDKNTRDGDTSNEVKPFVKTTSFQIRQEKLARMMKKAQSVAHERPLSTEPACDDCDVTDIKSMVVASNEPYVGDLSTANATANATSSTPIPVAGIIRNKSKQGIAVREAARLQAVQQHPAFKAQPLVAMRAHLEHLVTLRAESNLAGDSTHGDKINSTKKNR